jgi:magnesium transporter
MGRMGAGFYLQPNLSGVSMDSTALLDHREQVSMRPRRSSTAALGLFDQVRTPGRQQRHGGGRSAARDNAPNDGQSSESETGENAPLIRSERLNERPFIPSRDTKLRPSTSGSGGGRASRRADLPRMQMSTSGIRDYGSVNFPPSVPTSPSLPPSQMQGNLQGLDLSPSERGDTDTIIHIGADAADDESCMLSAPTSPRDMMRSSTHRAEEDVCFPVDDGLLLDDEEATVMADGRRRSRRREWPDLSVLEEWSRDEKEERSEGIRAKKLPEPVYVGGRLRPPVRAPWHRCEDDLPYRFTYFNDELPATIHAHTISELLLPGQTFADLFRPEPRVLDDSSSEEESEQSTRKTTRTDSKMNNGVDFGTDITPPEPSKALPRLGPRPTFWLDVFQPTEAEMKVLSKAFGIHPLTTEDIMMQEAREKVELFRTYYLVSYRTFEQDSNSENFMEPVNIYIVVFRDGIVTVCSQNSGQSIALMVYIYSSISQ